MKNLFNNMDSSEKDRILEMHKKQGHLLSEQNPVLDDKLPPFARDPGGKDRTGIPGLDNKRKQGGLRNRDIKVPESIIIGSSLFRNGVANIDRNNPKYKEAIASLKKIPSDASVSVIGGASAVGSKTFGKEQNQKLAMLRATNFINAAKSDGVKITMTPSGVVGKNTEKNSPGAEAEQFVKIEFNTGFDYDSTTDIDNTAVNQLIPGGDDFVQGGGGSLYKMCIGDLTATEYMELLKRFKNKIKSRGIQ
jgi:hypothetical protein